MDRREILRRRLAVDARWGIGRASCHDVQVIHHTAEPEPQPGEDYYVVSLDVTTGEVTTTQAGQEASSE